MKLSPVVRTAIFVNDLNRSEQFYESVFGLRDIFFEGVLDDPGLPALLGLPPEQKVRAKILQVEGCSHGMIGLFEIADQEKQAMENDRSRARAGRACLVLYCDDLTTLHQRLVTGGHDVITPPIPFQAPGRHMQREMSCLDPDGMMINIIERTPEGAFVGS